MRSIINIILKQNWVCGINGNVALTASTRQKSGSLNLNMRQGDFGMNAFVNDNYRVFVDVHSTSSRNSVNIVANQSVLFNQDGVNRFDRHGIFSKDLNLKFASLWLSNELLD